MVVVMKEKMRNASRPRLSGKVSTVRLTEGASVSRHERIEISLSRHEKSNFYRTVLNPCLSFLNGRKKRSGIQ